MEAVAVGITHSLCVLSDFSLLISVAPPFVNTYLTDDKTFRTVFICTTVNTLPKATELMFG